MPYIKSHSNWVLQSKHQDVKDGTIYERDITTIGGIGNFNGNQTPIYRSNNFIVTVNNDDKSSNQYNTDKWKENETSGAVWNLESISGLTSDTIEDNDTKIVLKQDYYDLNDFAYYGSLTELFRTSVTDIVARFPGELYHTDYTIYYTSSYTEDFETVETQLLLSNDTYIDNPFGINVYSATVPEGANELKYFANGGYNNYEIITKNSTSAITSWETEWFYSKKQTDGLYTWYSATTTSNEVMSFNNNRPYPCKGDTVAIVRINNNEDLTITVKLGDNNTIYYFAKGCDCTNIEDLQIDTPINQQNNTVDYEWHIRPKKEFLDTFYNECDNFEKLLMNRDTDYKAVFSVIRENEEGYYRELVPFQFPKGEGGYNIDTSDYGFNTYTKQMVEIGEYYDENFTDNLWRSMTHEAIKNFDWTYTREFQEGDEEEYVFGGQRIQKALRLFAREFDEILSYINNIKSINRITYDERSNVPDYFLTDVVENSGWNVKLIYPYTLNEYTINENNEKEVINEYSEGGNCVDGQLDNLDNGKHIFRVFSQDASESVAPYSDDYLKYKNGYFITCNESYSDKASCGSNHYRIKPSSGETTWNDSTALGNKGSIKNVIKNYSNNTSWSYQECNNEFLRRLKINSPYIWRNKGTVEGIEMILGMFGLKSKRWVDTLNRRTVNSCEYSNITYDYEVTEYTSFAHRIEEPWDAVHQDYRINWINSTKTIAYDTRSVSNYNKYGLESERIPYEGIPVSYRDEYESEETPYIKVASLEDQLENGVTPTTSADCFTREDGSYVLRRYLYPNFNAYEELDGNPYFQMDGGWLSKVIDDKWNFQYDVDDNIVYSSFESGNTLYLETVRNIRREDNVNDLLSIPTNELYNGIICNVTRIEEKSAVIDGVMYPIQSEWYGSGETAHTVDYVSFVKSDGYVKVGLDKYFDSTIIVYNTNIYDVESTESAETLYNIENKNNGYEVKAYISGDSFVCKEDSEGNYSISSFIRLDTEWNKDDEYTNYFVLDDINYASEIARYDSTISGYTSGWKRLKTSDSNYIKINTIINNNKGNNPHNGNMVYDNGHEYFTYFKKIFKHAVDNELFDSRCYDDFYDILDTEIFKYGFSGLVDDNEDVKKYDNFLNQDTKVHYFGNHKEFTSAPSRQISSRITEEANCNCSNISYIEVAKGDSIWIYGQDNERIEGFKKIYGDVKNYILSNNDGWIEDYNPYSAYTISGVVDEVTNQIVNNKRLTINFNLHYDWYTNQGQCEIKYIDDIIMNYLTQMIPSSTILQVKYTSKESD